MTREEIIKLASTITKESRFVDFKSELDTTSALSWCDIAKDLVAMANSGGGIIVFGVNDNGSYSNFDKNVILTLDPALISEKVSKFLDVDFIDFEQIEINRGSKKFAGIYVGAVSVPYVFSTNGVQYRDGKKHKHVFAEGTIYFRRGAKSRPGNTEYLKRSFESALEQVRKEWFKGVRKLTSLGVDEIATVEVKELKNTSAILKGMIKLSEKGVPVKFTNEKIIELKKLYPLEYAEVVRECKNKKKVTQIELQAYIDSCKENTELSVNWGLIGRHLEIPVNIWNKHY
jgi:Putative DNA-binding domain